MLVSKYLSRKYSERFEIYLLHYPHPWSLFTTYFCNYAADFVIFSTSQPAIAFALKLEIDQSVLVPGQYWASRLKALKLRTIFIINGLINVLEHNVCQANLSNREQISRRCTICMVSWDIPPLA
jgi:hypothetical protein